MSDKDIDYCYTFFDLFWTESLGEYAGLAHGLYRDKAIPFLQAQDNQRQFVIEQLNIHKNTRVIDIGCGYGQMLNKIISAGGIAKGITISKRQTNYCRSKNLNVDCINWKDLTEGWHHQYDCIIANGSLEHFVKPQEVINGQAEQIYRDFFKKCSDLLDPTSDNQRLFISFIFQKKFFTPQAVLGEYKTHDEYMTFLINKMFGGGWYPYGYEEIIRYASDYFEPIYTEENTKDYLQTYYHVRDACYKTWSFKKILKLIRHGIPFIFRDKDFIYRLKYCYHGAWGWQFEGNNPPTGLISITFKHKKAT